MKSQVRKHLVKQLLSAALATVLLMGVVSLNAFGVIRVLPFETSLESSQDEVVCMQVGLVITSDDTF